MPIIIIACIYVHFFLKGDGECSKKGKRISFSFESPLFSLFHLNPSLKRYYISSCMSCCFFSFVYFCIINCDGRATCTYMPRNSKIPIQTHRPISYGPSLGLKCFLFRQRNQFFYLFRVLDPTRGLFDWTSTVFVTMGTTMKGIYKGFNNFFSQIFVVKEREMEIGYPTDVKHVAHIGWDGASGAAPSWMNEFKTGPEFAATSIGNSGSALSPWSSKDFGENMGHQSTPDMLASTDLPNVAKSKQKRKKSKSNSSPRSNSSSTSKSSRAAKSKAKFVEGNAKPANIEVA